MSNRDKSVTILFVSAMSMRLLRSKRKRTDAFIIRLFDELQLQDIELTGNATL